MVKKEKGLEERIMNELCKGGVTYLQELVIDLNVSLTLIRGAFARLQQRGEVGSMVDRFGRQCWAI